MHNLYFLASDLLIIFFNSGSRMPPTVFLLHARVLARALESSYYRKAGQGTIDLR